MVFKSPRGREQNLPRFLEARLGTSTAVTNEGRFKGLEEKRLHFSFRSYMRARGGTG